MLKHYRRTFTALLTIFALSAICASWSLSAPPDGKGKPPKDDGDGGGTIYARIGLQYYEMSSDGSVKTPLPLFDPPGAVEKEPSRALHGGARWFLEVRELAAGTYPDGSQRIELFAVRDDGNESVTVQLTDLPDLEISRGYDFFARWAADGVVSFVARRWVAVGVVQAGIYSAQIEFDGDGNVGGLMAQPDPFSPLVPLGLVEGNSVGITDYPDIKGFDWHPFGTAIVYAAVPIDTATNPIFIVELPAGVQSQLTTGGWDPVWSPDGAQIAFTSSEGIDTINVDGSGRVNVIARDQRKNAGFQQPSLSSWSPTGSHLAYKWSNFAINSKKHVTDVYRATSTGANKRNLTSDTAFDTNLLVGWR